MDCILFVTFKGFPFLKDAKNLIPFSKFAVRTYACCLFPFILQGFLLREEHIRHTKVGRVLGYCFILEHTLSIMWYWISARRVGKAKDGFKVEPFRLIVTIHVGWTIWAIVAMLYA